MSRITKSNLIAEIEKVNNLLKESGSIYRYKYQSRNNYHAVDLERFEGDRFKTVKCLDCAEPPKVLILKLLNDYKYYLGLRG
jgi:hypothetical protein